MIQKVLLFTAALAVVSACQASHHAKVTNPGKGHEVMYPGTAGEDGIAGPMREWRAAWVATVANIDWPTKPGLSTADQKAEAIRILDAMEESNMNAVVLQVRPHADALYKSDIEPWSYYLTGEQGKAPDPYYDPLEYWIEEAHLRGLELHVWFNPYRAHHTANKGEVAENQVLKANPEMVHKLANGMWWMDPAREDVQKRSLDVMMDVVRRYDIDGVHMDDYFYPYQSYNDNKDFPDDAAWAAYQTAGGALGRADWRRKAVDDFVEDLYLAIKAEKPEVRFGLSPFGIWRPGNPPGIAGLDQYNSLYADAKKWLNEGWVDYYTPQLYWPTWRPQQSFPMLVGWWDSQNWHDRNLWPGMSISAAGARDETVAQRESDDTFEEIMILRGMLPESPGHCLFSVKYLVRNDGNIATRLRDGDGRYPGVYGKKALAPPSPWLGDTPPAAPTVKTSKDGDFLEVAYGAGAGREPFLFVVFQERDGAWDYEIMPAHKRLHRVQMSGTVTRTRTRNQGLDVETEEVPVKAVTRIAVSAVDRLGNESKRTIVPVD